MSNFYMKLLMLYYIQGLKKLFPMIQFWIQSYSLWIHIEPKWLNNFLFFLKNNTWLRYEQLTDIYCVDYPTKKKRFEVSYHLLSLIFNNRISISIFIEELYSIKTITNLYKTASWLEREIWDMHGISFIDHKDLRRILTDYGFKGHPLRKDFPMSGFSELFYSDIKKKVSYKKISLVQLYRYYNHSTQ